jgi:SAM-dependent methyltransferase
MSVFRLYSRYYDLLYGDKDYLSEAKYIDNFIRHYHSGARTVLDLGCGTGRHAGELVKRGYQVHGVDFSEEMLEKAKLVDGGGNLSFSQGDIRKIRLEKKFDVVTALFHVISYQTTNKDILSTFTTANEHLKDGGIFIFDCWYGPAVLTERPEVRVKRLKNEQTEITRIAEPVMHENENRVDVNYHIFVRDVETGAVEEIKETHSMRYLFLPEIEAFLYDTGFSAVETFDFLTFKKPGFHSWSIITIGHRL